MKHTKKDIKKLSDFIGKEVQIMPTKTHHYMFVYAILLEYNEYGYIFKITESMEVIYNEGDIVFINNATNITLKLIK